MDWRHTLRRNCLLYVIKGQLTEVKGIGKRMQLLDDFKNQKRYFELNEEAEDKKMWKLELIT